MNVENISLSERKKAENRLHTHCFCLCEILTRGKFIEPGTGLALVNIWRRGTRHQEQPIKVVRCSFWDEEIFWN